MKKIWVAMLFALSLTLVPASGVFAAMPDDAITGRLDSSFRLKLRLDNLENVKSVLDHPLVALYSAFLREEKTGGVMYALNLALGLNPKSIVFVVGTDAGQLFLQMAVSMPEAALPQLKSIELGKAAKAELSAFLAGGSQELAGLYPVVSEGINGPYYFFKDTVYLAARENLLLIALSLEDLASSLNALDKAGVNRFAVASPNKNAAAYLSWLIARRPAFWTKEL